MKTLLLETSSEKSAIALIDGETVISFPLEGGPLLSKNISLNVSLLLKQHQFFPEQIIIGEGPGSLTGVRVGAALGKALAFGWNIPLKTFCSLKLFTPKEEGAFAIVVDAKMERTHLLKGVKEKNRCVYEPLATLPNAEISHYLKEASRILSPHPTLIQLRTQIACEEATALFDLSILGERGSNAAIQ